jgi:hypothetical protein
VLMEMLYSHGPRRGSMPERRRCAPMVGRGADRRVGYFPQACVGR